MGFHFNISATTKNSNFKIGRLVGFAKAHHKVLPRKKRAVTCGGELPNIWGFPFNIYAMDESIDFKFGMLVLFAKVHHKITLRGEVGMALS